MRPELLPDTFEGKLDHAIEECCEFIQAVAKLRRFGETPVDPKTGVSYNNIADMRAEMSDVEYAFSRIKEHLNAR